MSFLALTLIVISAFMHATWNYLAKRSEGGYAFVWLYMMITLVVFAPFVIGLLIFRNVQIGWLELGFMLGSALIHLAYSLLLQKGYKVGDFSLVYPVCRGTGPLIVTIAAVFIYDEKLTTTGVIGIALITGSIFVITGGMEAIRKANTFIPLLYGMLIGVMIASYTLLDKGAVSVAMMSPLMLIYGSIVAQAIILSLFVFRSFEDVRHEWRHHKKEAIGVGILNQFAYVLVLTAMTFTPVSYVAPVREMSILIGTIMGTRMLSEGFGPRRIVAAGTMVAGVIAVAVQ
ncbi:EamA family transporter [Lentibacillus salicampi]|uniref:EamA family transporter n=1 Tax=Lentibacillus salicampi TaxID=175306 RepID=A0A4Y9AGR2_9BACI|nr:EamA family transporter [Lentibacillus salicampi]TFJ94160.1 EamA family transporter [Lentibacillus salicampi]